MKLKGALHEDALFERAVAVFRSRPGQGICTRCLCESLACPASYIMWITLGRLQSRADVTRSFGACAICKEHRHLLRAKDRGCPACEKPIEPGAPVSFQHGELLHLSCYEALAASKKRGIRGRPRSGGLPRESKGRS